MRKERERSLTLCALAAPAVQAAAACSWATAAVLCVLAAALCGGEAAMRTRESRIIKGIKLLWTTQVIACALQWVSECWDGGGLFVPVTLLLASAYAACGENGAADRACANVRWAVYVLLGAVLLGALPEASASALTPVWETPDWRLLVVLLLPAAAIGTQPKGNGQKAVLCAVCVGTAALAGCVLRGLTVQGEAFMELSKTVRLFGVAERFEALAAAGLTLGYFAMLTWLLSGYAAFGAEVSEGQERIYVLAAMALSLVQTVFGWVLSVHVLVLGSLAAYVLIPLAGGLLSGPAERKKGKKGQKSA